MNPADAPRQDEPGFPLADRRVVCLLDAASALEERILRGWVARNKPAGAAVDALPIPASRRKRGALGLDLEAALAAGDDALFAPLRVVWMTPAHKGVRTAQLSDLLWLGDPRDPDKLRERLVLRIAPQRCRIVAADPARASELRERWRRNTAAESGATLGFAEFVVRQAHLALERAERRLRGARYKIPRFVREEILARPAFRGEIALLAARLGRGAEDVLREAERDLREIAAAHRPTMIDLIVQFWRYGMTRGYDQVLRYDPAALARIRDLSQHHSVVFLPTHKSNLDHAVLQVLLHENGMPQNHTAGGINMNFFPVGPLVRRSGVFFIRRTFKDDAVYKFVLRHYIDYLIEKRFSLEWYIEGGRSRSGKLLPPRFGLLAYVVDAHRRGKSEDVFLLPVAIAYDQIQDVGDYTAEQRGAAKSRESFGWFLRVVRGFRRRSGDIHLRFGEPISLRAAVGPPDPAAEPAADEQSLAIQKLAFEVSVRINRVTPITPISLLTLAMLGLGDRAATSDEIAAALRNLLEYVRRRELPTTGRLDLDTPEGLRRALGVLVDSGVVTCFAAGAEPVYAIGRGHHLAAAYYRNTIIHFFVTGAIGEVALLRAADDGVQDRRAEFWDEAMRLRDLMKFEFFFADRETFREELARELTLHHSDWEPQLLEGPAAILAVLRRIRPFNAHRVLLPFLQAYHVVSDALARSEGSARVDSGPFLDHCLALGTQYHLQRRIRSPESVSKVLFDNALRLARNRGLLEPGPTDLAERRRAFAEELRGAIRRAEAIEVLAASRRAGLIE